jgi:hypothetical protein
MAILRTLIGDRFPQLTSLVSSLTKLRATGLSIIEHSDEAVSASFDRFTASQPSAVSTSLESLRDSSKRQISAMKALFLTSSSLGGEIEALRRPNTELHRKQADTHAISQAAAHSRSHEARTWDALARAERHQRASDITKCQAHAAAARARVKRDAQRAIEADAELETFTAHYKAEFAEMIAGIFLSAVGAKERELTELSEVAQQIAEAAAKFEDFEDEAAAELRRELEELDALLIE